ncbi:MAG: saccharopine dehydrogenase [Bilophila wadsworthia]
MLLVINCAAPLAVRERVAAAVLAGGCHYVDPVYAARYFPGGRKSAPAADVPAHARHPAGPVRTLPVYVARTCFDQVGFEYACVGRDRWTFPSAWDIAWGVGNIGNGEAPVYYEQGVRRQAGLLASGRRMDLPAPVGRHTVFRLMRDDLQLFVEESGISEAHVYGNNWGCWVTLATVLVRLAGWYGTERRLAQSARLIMRAAELDMRGRKPGFMLHLRMRGMLRGKPRSVVRTLFLEDTYRATGLCAAIGARLAAEGMEPDGSGGADADPQVMRHFRRQ